MDKRICVYEAGTTDFASNGLGTISPTKCRVHWQENGEYSVEIEHPIDDLGKYERICVNERVVVVPVPEAPSKRLTSVTRTAAVEIYTIATRKSRLRLRSGPGTGYRCLGYYAKGKTVTLIEKTNSSWYEVTAPDGKHGWMSADYLKYSHSDTARQTVSGILQELPMRPQPFDIHAIDPDVRRVTVRGRHVFWRLAENIICGPLEIKNMTAQQALDAVFAAAEDQDHGFHWYAEGDEKHSLEDPIEGRSLSDVLLGDGGICETYGLKLLADWFDVFLVKEIGENRGVQLRYAKNVKGLEGGFDLSNVVTRPIPVGRTKDGEPLFLSGAKYLLSENEKLYTRPRWGYLNVSEAKVGSEVDGEKLTVSTTRKLMEKTAQARLSAGCDLPECSLQARMAQLRYDPAYQSFADLERICPGDTLGLFMPNFALALHVRLSEYDFDALSQRYEELTLGNPAINASRTGITSRQLGGASVTSGKLAPGAVGASALQSEVIAARHVQADSINAQALQAGSVTAEKIAAGALDAITIEAITAHIRDLVAGTIDADQLYADLVTIAAAQISTANIDKAEINWAEIHTLTAHFSEIAAANIEWADIETLNAQIASIAQVEIEDAEIDAAQILDLETTIAQISSAQIESADIDFAQIKDLAAGTAIITEGVGGRLYISRLAVTEANMVSLTVGELIVKGSDGCFYSVSVDADGNIVTELKQVSNDDVKDLSINAGEKIIEGSITAACLNAQDIFADSALIRQLIAANIDVATLFAREATIDQINALDIRGNKYLQLTVGEKATVYRSEEAPTDANANDLWIQPSTGAMYQMAAAGGLPGFYIDDTGILYYQYGKDQTEYALALDENGDLYTDEDAPFIMDISPDGKIIAWERVKDGELQAAIDGNSELIKAQSTTITEMAGAIDLRVTTEVYEQDAKDTKKLIEKNQSAITALDRSITSKVSQEVYNEELGIVRGDVSEIKQTATDLKLEVAKKTATFCQESAPEEYLEGDIWIKPSSGEVYEAVKNDSDTLEWQKSVLTPSQLKTSYIEIAQDHIDISTGGKLNVDSGAAHFRTKDYTLSILADDSSEETVLDFDADSKTLRVDEIVAGNTRPYISGVTRVTSSNVGGLDGLAGLLANNQYEQIVYTQVTDDPSGENIIIKGSDSLVVKIIADDLTRVPPIEFRDITGNVYLENLKWSANGTAVKANSGSVVMRDCYADSRIGVHALDHARISWIGRASDETGLSSAGTCTTAAKAQNGAEIKLFGLIPKSSSIVEEKGGTVQSIDTFAFDGSSVVENITVSLPATTGYYGTKNGWHSDQLYQGYSSGKGTIYGCMKFEIPSGVGTIQNAMLILHRYKGAGKGAEVDVNVRGSGTAFGSRPTLGTAVYASREDAAAPGATVSFDVTAAAQALADGSIAQLVLYTGESSTMSGKVYSSQYALFDEATLKITY